MGKMTYDTARRIATKRMEPVWDNRGTMFAALEGWEDSRDFAVPIGAEEWLIDEDDHYVLLDAPLVLVNKTDGKAVIATYLDDPDRFDKMAKVSAE